MNNENTATAMAVSGPSGLESASAVIDSWSPEDLKMKIANERQMREILRDYVKSELKQGHHYSTTIGTQQLAKPMLLQEGARNIVSLFNLHFGPPQLVEERLDGDHYRVRAHIAVHNSMGRPVTTGDGLCSTLETKYAYRRAERECPNCGAEAIRKDNKSPQGGFYCWAKLEGCGAKFKANDERITGQQIGRRENQDKADVENTVLKMAIKRAKVAAVCDLPTVSEIFAPEEGDAGQDPPTAAKGGVRAGVNRPHSAQQQPPPSPPSSPEQPETSVDTVRLLVKKLAERGMDEKDLGEQFLPEGVAGFAELSPEQAEEIRPAIVELLNAKVKEK